MYNVITIDEIKLPDLVNLEENYFVDVKRERHRTRQIIGNDLCLRQRRRR